jgi:hypothetical protein
MKPTVEITGRRVFLLSGFRTLLKSHSSKRFMPGSIQIEDLGELRRSANKHPDAVAFGYVAGRWVPGA